MIRTPLQVCALMAVVTTLTACAEQARLPELISEAPYAPESGSLLIRCGTLIDGVSDQPAVNVSVLVDQGRIKSVGNVLEAPSSVETLDLSDRTCLPGFVDMHTHILEDPEDTADLRVYFEHTLEQTLETGRHNARTTLDIGFTTIRNLGVYYGWSSRDLRDEIDRGDSIGPRMQIAGFYLTIPGGGGDLLTPGVEENVIPPHVRLGVARGAEEFRQKGQDAVDGGADLLKMIASGAVLAYGGVPGSPEMTPEEIAAVVEVGHAAGLRVTAHAHGAQSIKDAIRAGVDSIEHASLIDDEGIQLAAEHNVALSMDIFGGDWIAVEGRKQNWPEEFIRKNDETTLIQRQNFRKAHAAGVPIVFGTDAGIYPHGLNTKQFRYMVEWGMTPMEAIKAATSVAARYMGWDDRIGSIQSGYYADIVAVDGDPLADISILERVDTVIKGGLVFKAPTDRVR